METIERQRQDHWTQSVRRWQDGHILALRFGGFLTEVAKVPRLVQTTGELLTAHEHGTLSNPGN